MNYMSIMYDERVSVSYFRWEAGATLYVANELSLCLLWIIPTKHYSISHRSCGTCDVKVLKKVHLVRYRR